LKAKRQMKILEIIRNQVIETQEELTEKLRQEGIKVTQATVSRDIKELKLVKTATSDGRYRYTLPQSEERLAVMERLRRVFRECCVGFDYSHNIVVVKTLSGAAPAVGEAIDNLGWEEVVGTVAGDNTVLMAIRDANMAPTVLDKLRQMMS